MIRYGGKPKPDSARSRTRNLLPRLYFASSSPSVHGTPIQHRRNYRYVQSCTTHIAAHLLLKQLLGRYVGQFSMDPDLFGGVTKTYISANGVPFTPGDVAVFEGVNHVLHLAGEWYTAKVAEKVAGEKKCQADREQPPAEEIREDNHAGPTTTLKQSSSHLSIPVPPSPTTFPSFSQLPLTSPSLPAHIKIHSSPPITASKSIFIGHACRVTHPLDVPLVIHHLLGDKKIAKAAHPVIHAYRIVEDGKQGQQVIVAGTSFGGGNRVAVVLILRGR